MLQKRESKLQKKELAQMHSFIELTEQKGQIVFAFGRFNPPTTGHEKLISKVAQVSGSSPYRIYPSFSQNPKKDPLPHALKVAYMKRCFLNTHETSLQTKMQRPQSMLQSSCMMRGSETW